MIFPEKKHALLDMLLDVAENVKVSADYAARFKISNGTNLNEFSHTMKEYEKKGDTFVHQIIVTLNKTFITPLEREDILSLAIAMDDILDGLEQYASRLQIYNITQPDQFMGKFCEKIYESAIEVAAACRLLSRKKLMDIRPHAIKINEYETECDELLRESITHLFGKETDPIKIIQYKELYETLEEISDSCEDAADILESIIMRNA